MNTDPTGTDPTGTDPTGAGSPVTISEIAEFLGQLRALSGSSPTTTTGGGGGLGRDTTAERAAFLARKADLFARIAAAHPDLTPPTTAPPTTAPPTTAPPTTAPPTARPDGEWA
jgi:hypothetical protein